MSEPLAIIGMACRFPGAPNLDAYWELLAEGRNAITESNPGSRIGRVDETENSDSAQSPCRFGGFLEDIDLFDPVFFRMSPFEAQIVDPQHRLMLETAWRALEDAGLNPDRLRGTRTGVYTGASNMEYRQLVFQAFEQAPETADRAAGLYANLGTNLNGISGRLAFLLGLEGPVMAVDTACSSSLVAAHEAATALQHGEADLALAAGVNVILDTRRSEMYAVAGTLSPDGQCKAFDASANGWVRGEGCGVVVLKRLSDAVADGDRVWCVLRGSAVNHDGASTAYAAPNDLAQRRVFREALARAGVAPASVDYVEAHGTGTPVGDPIELSAVAAVYCEGRDPERPLLIGSAKSNLGHLEPVAGVAGLIKTALAIHHGLIPRHLHFESPNPAIDWDRLPIRVAEEATPWPLHPALPPLAAVSSYGMSGTNAHVVLEGYRDTRAERDAGGQPPTGPARRVAVALPEPFASLDLAEEPLGKRATRILPLSSKDGAALRELAQGYESWLGDAPAADDATISDLAWTACTGRSHFNHRAAVVFDDAESLHSQLGALANGATNGTTGSPRKVAFAYSGQGSQWSGMGRDLYETEPVARAVMDRCEAVNLEETGESLLDVMFGRTGAGEVLDRSEWAQPALYALDCALTALWASAGVQPAVVIGHSFGEQPAAQAAGVLSLEDGMRLAILRGRLISQTEPGAGAAIFAPRAEVESVIEEINAASKRGLLGIASDNGLNQVVSGLADEVDAISAHFEENKVRVRRMNLENAAHNPLLEPILPAFEASANQIDVGPPKVPFVSNLTGGVIDADTALDGAYWRQHLRQPVAFADGVETLANLGVDTVIEIGPHAVLGPMISMIWPRPPGTPGAAVIIASMQRPEERGGTEAASGFIDAVAEAYTAGLDLSFEGLFAGEKRSRVSIPGYPFQRDRYWLDAPPQQRSAVGHPLLGLRHESPHGEVSFETHVGPSSPPWLREHRVFGRVLAPGAMYGAMVASALLSESATVSTGELQLFSPLIFPAGSEESQEHDRRVQLVLGRADGQKPRSVEIYSKGAEADWTLHARGSVPTMAPIDESEGSVDFEYLKTGMTRRDTRSLYQAKRSTGVELGAPFQGLTHLWQGRGEAVGEIVLPSQVDRNGIEVHPLLLDACFQVMSGARDTAEGDTTVYMPFGWERLWLNGPLPERLVCRAKMRDAGAGADASEEPAEVLKSDLWIYDEDGVAIGGISGFTTKRATRAALLTSLETVDDLMYEVVWRELPSDEAAQSSTPPERIESADDSPGVWILAADRSGIAERIAVGLADRNQTVVVTEGSAGRYPPVAEAGVFSESVDSGRRESWLSLIERLPDGVPLRGVVHLPGLDGHGDQATTEQLKEDVTRSLGSALALVQGLIDADAAPEHGIWFVSRGGQVLHDEQGGELAGATLWGFGKVIARELSQLPARIVDLDPGEDGIPASLIDELLNPGAEDLIAYRAGSRHAQRIVRGKDGTRQLLLPDNTAWRLCRDADDKLRIESQDPVELGFEEIRLAVEAAGPRALDADAWEVCGRIIEIGEGVTGLAVGDRVVGVAVNAPGPMAGTAADLVTLAPTDVPAGVLVTALAEHDSPSVTDLIESERTRIRALLAELVEHAAARGWGTQPPARRAISEAAPTTDSRHTGRAFLASSPIATGRLRDDRTYLVTGGLGGIGGATAVWLADRGARTIVLNGRRAPDAAAEETIHSLRERGVDIRVELADVANAGELRAMLRRIDATLPPLGGVVHSAVALSDAAVVNQSWDRFEEVLWSKVLGAWELHRQTEDRDLDLFVLYSSMAGVRGNSGQANYCAANSFVDELARYRRARGLPGQAIQWGAWSGVGGADRRRDQLQAVVAASGYDWMTPAQGIRALDQLVRQDLAVAGVTLIDWDVYASSLRAVPPLIEELVSEAAPAGDVNSEVPGGLISRVREAPEGQRHGILEHAVQSLLQELLRMPAPPDPNVAFFDLGLDSLTALELRSRLNLALGGERTVASTVAFDYSDVASLAGHLVDVLSADHEQAPEPSVLGAAHRQPSRDPGGDIAIVGMACKLPGANDLSAFWRLLEASASGVSNARRGSGSWAGFFGDADAAEGPRHRAGFVEGLDQFDASFFRITPIEARNMDPQLRMLLETTWHALEDAGIDPDTLRGSRTGAYVGIGHGEYRDVMHMHGESISYMGINGSTSVGRLAFALGLEGPALPVEVACASSLVAVHHAVTALRHGEINLALVAGVNAALSPDATLKLDRLGMLSSDGECRSFSTRADGFIRGEGCGVVVLRRLSEALEDGHRIWGVVRGSGVNQSGMGASPTAPSGSAQQRVVEQALSSAGVNPADVDYLEAHGTATDLGDAIELEAATAVYGRGRETERPLLVGSVKTNIGHTESTAGMAGLIKTVLSMERGVIPAHLHLEQPSEHIEWGRLPVQVTSSAMDWPDRPGRQRLAAVSAFGMTGANAHVVVAGYEPGASQGTAWASGAPKLVKQTLATGTQLPASEQAADRGAARFLALSAKSPDALRDLARGYLTWLEAMEGTASESILADAAWTAGVGRSHFEHRAGLDFRDSGTLRDALRALADSTGKSEVRAARPVGFAYGPECGELSPATGALYESEPLVRAVLDRCEEVFRAERHSSLLGAMFDENALGGGEPAAWRQPAAYALQCALTTLWASVGIRPDIVFGYGVGELAAAQAAGIFGVDVGMRLAIARAGLADRADDVSSQVDEDALDVFDTALAGSPPARSALPVVSSATGELAEASDLHAAAYWKDQALQPAEFADGSSALAEFGMAAVVNIGANERSLGIFADREAAPTVIASPLDGPAAGIEPSEAFVRAVARAYEAGLDVAFRGLFAGELRSRVSLPGYPFQRDRYWQEPARQ